MTESTAREMYRLLAIAKYNERYVIPTVERESKEDLYQTRGEVGSSRPRAGLRRDDVRSREAEKQRGREDF